MKSSGELCKELNIKYYKLDYIIRNGFVPEPEKLGSRQRVFTDEDVLRIKAVIKMQGNE